MKNKKLKLKIISGVFFALAFIGLLFFLFSGDNLEILKSLFTEDYTKEELKDRLRDFGIKGYITISILAMLQIIIAFLPAEPVQVIAGVTFGFIRGFAACMVGVLLGNTLIYVLYKIFGERLNDYFDKNLDIDIEKASSSGKITLLIFILYFLPAIPYGMICFFASTMRFKYPKYIAVTLLGAIPSVCIGVGLGHIAISASWILSLVVFAVLLALLGVLLKKKDVLMVKVNAFLQKSKAPHSTKTEVREYSKFKLSVLYVCSRILFFFRGVRVKYINKAGKPERPSIVLVNHGAFADFAYSGSLLRRECPNFIVNRMYFYRRDMAWLLRGLGCFPKSMFTADLESMKNSLKVIKRGGILAFMPEARLSTAGEFEDIQDGTFAFIKKMGVPVYTIKICGDYLASPKWGDGMRLGSYIEATLEELFTPKDLEALSEGEVEKALLERLYYNEFEWLKSNPKVRYRKKTLAVGLENILAICPGCKQKHTFKAENHTLTCEKCGLTTKIDDRYKFDNAVDFENHLEWYRWQYNEFSEEIKKNPEFTLSDEVILKSPSTDGKKLLRESGRGRATLGREGLTYVGTKDGVEIEKHFPLSRIYRLLFGAGEDFELYDGSEIYYFLPGDGRSAVDWYMVSKILKETPGI